MLKDLVHKNLKYFLFFFKHLRYKILFALIFSLVVGVLDGFGLAMILPLLQMVAGSTEATSSDMGNLSFIVDFIAGAGFDLTLQTVLIAMLVFFTLKGVARFYEIYYRVKLRFFFVTKLRYENINALTNLSYKRFVLSDSGQIQNTITGEVSRIVVSFSHYFSAAQNAMLVMVYLFLAFLANMELAVLVAIGGGLTVLIYRTIFKQSKAFSKLITASSHGFQGLLIQKVAFFKYLKASASINHYADRLKEKADDIENANKRIGVMSAMIDSSREPLIMIVVVGIIIVQVNIFGQSLGSILLSLMLLYRALTSMMLLQMQWNSFLTTSGSIENMQLFMQELNENQETYGESQLEKFNHGISVKNVSFSYGDQTVLRNINLEVLKNKTVAFVGESGSGKTTLVNLLAGLMSPDKGQIIIDGQDLSALDVRTYQRRIGYITQEPVIFSDTIYNNVTFWAEKTPENEQRFWETLKRASIDKFVGDLPEAENAPLGSNGILVSGGQKQRLSIARELYKDVDILIMDEATSALDSETEKTIQRNIDLLKGSYTFLIVAHRLSTVKNADTIVLMNNGVIEEMGSFAELTEKSPSFKKMVELQEI